MATGISATMLQLSGIRKVRFVSHMSSSHQPQSMATPIQAW